MKTPCIERDLHWFAVPCEAQTLHEERIDESGDGNALGSWLMEMGGPRCLSVQVGGSVHPLRMGVPFGPFDPQNPRPTQSPAGFLEELHTAFGWQLLPLGPERSSPAYAADLRPIDGSPVLRLRDPVLGGFRGVLGSLAERGFDVGLRVDLAWNCCSSHLEQVARLALKQAVRRRRPRRMVLRLAQVWVDTVQLRVSLRLVGDADPGRLVESRLCRALSHDVAEPLVVGAQPQFSSATPDVLFGLLSLCALSEDMSAEEAAQGAELSRLMSMVEGVSHR